MGDLAKPGNKEKLSVKAAFGFIELTLNSTSLTVIGLFFFFFWYDKKSEPHNQDWS